MDLLGGGGGGVLFFVTKQKSIRDKMRYSNLSNNMMIKVELHEQQNCCNLQQNLISTHVK
jgi:hypothetical protein